MSIALIALLECSSASATTLIPCFTPGENCTGLIVLEFDSVKSELLVKA